MSQSRASNITTAWHWRASAGTMATPTLQVSCGLLAAHIASRSMVAPTTAWRLQIGSGMLSGACAAALILFSAYKTMQLTPLMLYTICRYFVFDALDELQQHGAEIGRAHV